MLTITDHCGNTSQNRNELPPHTCQGGYYQRQEMRSIGENMEKRETFSMLVRMEIGTAIWKTAWRLLKKLKTELPCDPATPLLGVCPEDTNPLPETSALWGSSQPVHSSKVWKQLSVRHCAQGQGVNVKGYVYIYISTHNGIFSAF